MAPEGPSIKELSELPIIIVDNQEALDKLTSLIQRIPSIPIDTEANVLDSYPPQLCLLQLATSNAIYIIDPLTNIRLEAFITELVRHELIIHCAELDLELLHQTFRALPEKIFDTYLAARLLGHAELSLAALLEKYFNVQLKKKFQKADWRIRPLSRGMIQYAANDVRYLGLLAEEFRSKLQELKRIEWLNEWCEVTKRNVINGFNSTEDAWRIKGSSGLAPLSLAILRDLWHWRERTARKLNTPPFQILRNKQLIQLAIEATNATAYDRFIPPHLPQTLADELKNVVAYTKGSDPATWPYPPERGRLTPEQRAALERLINRRNQRAKLLGIDPTIIASKNTLIKLVVNWEKYAPTLMSWQRALLQ